MPETPVITPGETSIDSFNLNPFKLDVQIGDLAYTLEGEAPDEPTGFELVVSLPESAWSKIKPEVNDKVKNNKDFAVQYDHLQGALHLGEARVGSVWVRQANAQDEALAIGISSIQTDNFYLPETSEYYRARGIGSLLLDSLCTSSDKRGWRIYLEPSAGNSRQSQTDLTKWYERHGFRFLENKDRNMSSAFGSMLRLPQQPDMSQPLAVWLDR